RVTSGLLCLRYRGYDPNFGLSDLLRLLVEGGNPGDTRVQRVTAGQQRWNKDVPRSCDLRPLSNAHHRQKGPLQGFEKEPLDPARWTRLAHTSDPAEPCHQSVSGCALRPAITR